jgi:zinc D-Ala-D-Ala carboxypeptidase
MEKISNHISFREAVYSDTAIIKGIPNIPDVSQLTNMKLLAEKVFEPMRIYFNIPILITSFFRSKKLNTTIGGAKNSQHMAIDGAALDMKTDNYNGITNEMIFSYILDNLQFDQLIAEDIDDEGLMSWVHVSYKEKDNRNQTLVMKVINGKKQYIVYEP